MPENFRNLPVFDGHIHYGHPAFLDGLVEIMDQNQLAKINIACTPHENRLSMVPDALHLKAHQPERVYVFGGLDISGLYTHPDTCGEYFANYVDTLVRMGCDGVKMIEGKPDTRRDMPVPVFDGPQYAPYWAKMEEMNLPLVFHVNDPEEFWDPENIPGWAKERGWFWGEGGYVNNEIQYTEVLNVLRRHPGLKVIFAHFFFLSQQMERLAGYLDEFPNMHVDLTPGVEMFYAFSRDPQASRDFFLKYQDRIVYGTDIGAWSLISTATCIDPVDSKVRTDMVRSFLELDGEFELAAVNGMQLGRFTGPFQAINLPDEALEKIYHANFERLAGARPRPLNPGAIVEECQRLADLIPDIAAKRGQQPDVSVAKMVAAYFQT